MQLPLIRGVIDRRILANYRVDPDVISKLLPAPFRPHLIDGKAMAGICLIRLKQTRPQFVPAFFGLQSENAAHRFAVEWDENGERRTGVYVPRRDTSSRLNSLLGGRVFPGEQHHANFQVREQEDRYQISLDSDDGQTHLRVDGHSTENLAAGSVFGSLQRASDFFERGSVGYSATSQPGEFDGLECRIPQWKVTPLAVDTMESSYFEDRLRFPAGSIQFDCALLMRHVDHQWCARKPICASK